MNGELFTEPTCSMAMYNKMMHARESFQRGTESQFNYVDLVEAMLAHHRCHD